jgi:hypothetical protein
MEGPPRFEMEEGERVFNPVEVGADAGVGWFWC